METSKSKQTIESVLTLLMKAGGMCYKKDFALVLKSRHESSNKKNSTNMANQEMARLVKKNYIEISSRDKHNLPHDTVRLTSQGIRHIAEKENLLPRDMLKNYPQFYGYTSKNIKSHLASVRLKLLFEICHVHVYDTPPLQEIYATPDSHKDLISQGLFYTDKQVRQFIDTLDLRDAETSYSTKFEGIYINAEKILVVFAEPPAESKLITVTRQATQDLLYMLKPLSRISEAYRNLYGFSEKTFLESRRTYVPIERNNPGEAYALIISNGYSQVYSGVIGKKYGHVEAGSQIDGYDKRKLARFEADKYSKKKISFSRYVLRADLDKDRRIFKRIFVTPFSSDGVEQLKYLLHTSIEEWYAQAKNIFSSDPFTCPQEDNLIPDQFMPGVYNNIPSCYLPVPELNILRTIHEREFPTAVLAPECLLEVYARSTRSDLVTFISKDKMSIKVTAQYAKSGYYQGRDLLMTYLKDQGLQYSEAQYLKMPSLFARTPLQFWNEVAQGSIGFDDIITLMEPSPLTEKKRSVRKRTKPVSTTLTSEQHKMLKLICSAKGITINRYIKTLLIPSINNDYEMYKPVKPKYNPAPEPDIKDINDLDLKELQRSIEQSIREKERSE